VEQRISLITLGVSDVARARAFYESLGWHGQQVENTVFFQAGAMALVLWHADDLAGDVGLEATSQRGFRGVALAQNVRSRADVDAIVARAESAGAGVPRRPADTFYGGYAGYFTDPDGHAWEVAYNPGFPLAADGSLTVPDFG
jgi:predicted lactoylglutathione lyase